MNPRFTNRRTRLALALLILLAAAAAWSPSPAVAQTYSAPITLYTFSGPDGEYPNRGLTMDSQGNLYGATAMGGPAFTFLNGGNDAFGTIYMYSTSTGALTTLVAFDGLDGFKPLSRITIDGQGNLWGATYQGGVDWNPINNHFGWGTVWKYSSAGLFSPGTVEFSGPDGANAIGNLALDSLGNLWGSTYQGGIGWNPTLGGFGNGTLFQLPPGLVRTSPARFIAPAIPASGPIFDSADNVFSTMTNGGLNGQGSLYERSAAGALTTLVSFDKATTGQMPNDVVMDSEGNLYGTTNQGGAFGFGTLWKYSAAGGFVTLAHFNGVNGQLPAGGLTLDANGNLFGTTVYGGANDDGVLYEYTPAGVLSTLFNFDGTNNGSHPEDSVVIDSQGNLYGTTDDGGFTGRGIVYTMRPVSTALTVSSVTIGPATIQGGGTSQGTVTLSGPAPAGGIPVLLGSNSSLATPEGPVTVPAGATSATFTIASGAVTNTTPVSIVASLGGSTQQASLTLTPPATVTLASIALNPDIVQGGNASTGTVSLNRVAPSGGVVVSLASDSSFAGVPSGVTVPAGAVSASFTIRTQAVSTNSFATITASLGTTSLQATLEVTNLPAITVGSLNVDPTAVSGGSPATGVVSLSRQSPAGGVVVALSSSGPASVPASVTVPAGYISAAFPVNTTSVSSSSTARITASLNGGSLQSPLTIVPAGSVTLSSISLSQPGVSVSNGNASSVTGGFSSQGILNLTGPAPTGDVVITLSSNSGLAGVPPGVAIPEGNTTTSFAITTQPVAANTTVIVTASVGSNVQQAALTLTPPPPAIAITSFTLNPSSVTGGGGSQGTVILNAPAPSGGTAVTFTSNTPAAAVPASIIIPAGSSSATINVATQPVPAATTANLFAGTVNGSREAKLTITPGTSTLTVSSLTLNPTSVQGGGSSTGTVTLSAAAPSGGTVVSLSSSASAATVPPSVTVAAGATSASFTVNTSAVTSNTTAAIKATLGSSSQQASLTITPVSALSLSSLTLNPTSVRGGRSSTGTVTLSGAAPSGGAVVTLSSSNSGVATVPASVTVPGGQTSASFTINTQSVNSNTTVNISGTYGGVTRTAALTVTRR